MTEKIEQALSPEEWAHWLKEPNQIRWEVERGADAIAYSLKASPAALLALCNAALPDDDPRKITREWVNMLRREAEAGEFADRVGDNAGFRGDTALLRQIADALESYLPPEPT